MKPKEKPNPRDHLTDDELAGFLFETVSDDEQRRVDAHLDTCAVCAAEIEGQSRATFDGETWERENRAWIGDLRERLLGSEIVSSQSDSVLELVGQPLSLEQIAAAERRDVSRLKQALFEISRSKIYALDDAIREKARRLNPAYDEWLRVGRSGRRARLDPPGEAAIALASTVDATVDGRGPMVTLSQEPTAGPRKGDSRYELVVSEEYDGLGRPTSFISIDAHGSALPLSWGFRLVFRPEDVAKALAKARLSRLDLGKLRAHHGDDEWDELLDLLLPMRYGASQDPFFARVISDGRVDGWLPGWPTSVKFWVDIDDA